MDNKRSPLISADDVANHLDHADVVVADARGGADARAHFEEEHLRGALFFDLETELSRKGPDPAAGGRHPLPGPGDFANLLGKAGISPLTQVLVYDDKGGANAAARLWWMLRAVGHERVQVIDGGLTALREAGLPMEKGQPRPFRKPQQYHATHWNLPVADMEAVENARSSSDSLVIDVREAYRYRGEREPIDEVAGHIPGAINLPYTENLDEQGRFLPANALREKYRNAIGTPPTNVIVHCGSGVTACHTLLAMAVAGIPDARLYVGSWSEWSRNSKPLATGPDS